MCVNGLGWAGGEGGYVSVTLLGFGRRWDHAEVCSVPVDMYVTWQAAVCVKILGLEGEEGSYLVLYLRVFTVVCFLMEYCNK